MRRKLATVAAACGLALAACGGGTSATPDTPRTVSSSGHESRADISDVQRALAATKQARTATYTGEVVMSTAGGEITTRQTGSYDLKARRGAIDQSMQGSPD